LSLGCATGQALDEVLLDGEGEDEMGGVARNIRATIWPKSLRCPAIARWMPSWCCAVINRDQLNISKV
jgi:hypothetical protein